MVKLVSCCPGSASEHDAMCVRRFAWEGQLWEQQEQLERELVEARRGVSSCHVPCLAYVYQQHISEMYAELDVHSPDLLCILS